MNPKSAVALAGGVGAARFLEGLIHVVPQERITIIGNVGDDKEVYGLHVSPDLDIVAYTLAGLVDADKGWGYSDDTFACQDMLERYGYEAWFNLGDRDLATHIYRTSQLRLGKSLSEVSEEITRHLGLRVRLLPATDDRLETYVITKEGRMHFQEYMVRLQTKPRVYGVRFLGARSAKPAKHVMESIAEAKGIIVSPSNPIVSIGAILAVPRIRGALQRTNAKVVAISPIVGGKTMKGPADKLMKALGVAPSALGVARLYRDFLDTLIIDRVDRDLASDIQNLGIKAVVTNTLMKTISDKVRLAKVAVSEFER
jgi:LPPG:FO 2-phospho-L-lactate transferase